MNEVSSQDVTFYERGRIIVRKSSEQERGEFLFYVGQALKHIESYAGNEGWWVVGGIAREAYLNNKIFVVRSPEGDWRDMDLLCDNQRAPKIRSAVDTYKGPLHIGGGSMQMYVHITEGVAFLRSGKTLIEVPRPVFDTNVVSLNGLLFPTLPCNTLLHLYLLHGRMREKDFYSALDLARVLNSLDQNEYPEEMYIGFHEFFDRVYGIDRKMDWINYLKAAAYAYRNSRLNKLLPINSGPARNFLFKLWDSLNEGVDA